MVKVRWNAIADLNKYNTDMEKSMKDKIFFLDHIKVADIDAKVKNGKLEKEKVIDYIICLII